MDSCPRRSTRVLLSALSLVLASASCNAATQRLTFVQPKLMGKLHSRQSLRPTLDFVIPRQALQRNGTNASVQDDFLETYLAVAEPRLLLLDIVSIAIAAQLMGLVDVLNDPVFWQNGGWHQGVEVPSTLPTLVRRDSILSICWILAALSMKGYELESINTVQWTTSKLFRISGVFVVLRVLTEFATVLALPNAELDGLDLARQCYFGVLIVGVFRFLYNRLFR